MQFSFDAVGFDTVGFDDVGCDYVTFDDVGCDDVGSAVSQELTPLQSRYVHCEKEFMDAVGFLSYPFPLPVCFPRAAS